MGFTGVIHAVDAHASGAHGRVVLGGVGVLDAPGATMLEKMKYFESHADWFRRLMLREPRGFPGAGVNLVLPPISPEADAGYVIMEAPDDYPPMSGSNTMCVVTVLLETGTLPMTEPVTELTLESPAGLIRVRADCANGKVKRVTLQTVPAFATHLGVPLEVPGIGTLSVDVAFGGVFYVMVESEPLGFRLEPREGAEIVRLALRVLAAAREQLSVAHPENPAADHVFSTLLYGPPKSSQHHGRNAVVLSLGAIDRSPCGTGTCARMAALYARGQLGIGQEYAHEGVLDTVFTGRIVRETRVGALPAVVPEISGRAWITGHAQYVLDADDPFPEGFAIADIWPASFCALDSPSPLASQAWGAPPGTGRHEP